MRSYQVLFALSSVVYVRISQSRSNTNCSSCLQNTSTENYKFQDLYRYYIIKTLYNIFKSTKMIFNKMIYLFY